MPRAHDGAVGATLKAPQQKACERPLTDSVHGFMLDRPRLRVCSAMPSLYTARRVRLHIWMNVTSSMRRPATGQRRTGVWALGGCIQVIAALYFAVAPWTFSGRLQ
ncbi:hypothetical protein BJX99DRAFT_232360 [Aspergillus californicus]